MGNKEVDFKATNSKPTDSSTRTAKAKSPKPTDSSTGASNAEVRITSHTNSNSTSPQSKCKKKFGVFVDIGMYTLLLAQMLYVITGNAVHEWLGMGFFVLLISHIVIKRRWFQACWHRSGKLFSARGFADLMIWLLMVCLLLLAISSMGVSRLLFPDITFLGNPVFHRTLATLGLTFAVIHGGMHGYFRAKKKRKAVAGIVILCVISLAIGFSLVPYLNRHYRTVEVEMEAVKPEQKLEWVSGKPLVVYFTRVGNTDFAPDIDAVSGASLLRADGELMGNTQFMAQMLQDILDCDSAAIELTDYKYPSSYTETCVVGGKEIKAKERPQIIDINTSEYDQIILVYPIWWGTIPMPVATFLESESFAEKQIYLIATQGSAGFASSTKDIVSLVPEAVVTEGISIYCDDIPDSAKMLIEWMLGEGYAK